MFFIILDTYTRWTFVIFSLVQRILLLIFSCHTVTHGTDLRRSPLQREFNQKMGRSVATRHIERTPGSIGKYHLRKKRKTSISWTEFLNLSSCYSCCCIRWCIGCCIGVCFRKLYLQYNFYLISFGLEFVFVFVFGVASDSIKLVQAAL